MIDYREKVGDVHLHYQVVTDMPESVRTSMGALATLMLKTLETVHPEYVFCACLECWGRQVAPKTVTPNSPPGGQPCGST